MQLKNIVVYEYDELGEKAKSTVIDKAITFLMDIYSEDTSSEEVKKAFAIAERLQTPWFTGSYIWEYANEEVLEIARGSLYSVEGQYLSHLIKEE